MEGLLEKAAAPIKSVTAFVERILHCFEAWPDDTSGGEPELWFRGVNNSGLRAVAKLLEAIMPERFGKLARESVDRRLPAWLPRPASDEKRLDCFGEFAGGRVLQLGNEVRC
jgi:hypothetical protein